ncbi:MAG TPA: phosphopantetheine-binding protein [Blastocatellia bacterium]|nr:phosphopantetheine-binding protein [Blastocatellia bacterium]
MNDLQQRIDNLSPEKRRLLERLLGEESNNAWSRAPYEAPRNETESKLAEIWSAVLGVGAVGVNDNYFELGGDSIQCIHIMSMARRVGIQITTKLLFEYPTIAQLAAVAETTAPVENILPSPAQMRAMIEVAESLENDGLTPVDFPDAELSPLELERILKG